MKRMSSLFFALVLMCFGDLGAAQRAKPSKGGAPDRSFSDRVTQGATDTYKVVSEGAETIAGQAVAGYARGRTALDEALEGTSQRVEQFRTDVASAGRRAADFTQKAGQDMQERIQTGFKATQDRMQEVGRTVREGAARMTTGKKPVASGEEGAQPFKLSDDESIGLANFPEVREQMVPRDLTRLSKNAGPQGFAKQLTREEVLELAQNPKSPLINTYVKIRIAQEFFGEHLQNAQTTKGKEGTGGLYTAVNDRAFLKNLTPEQFAELQKVVAGLSDSNENITKLRQRVMDGPLIKSIKEGGYEHKKVSGLISNLRPEHAQRFLDELPKFRQGLDATKDKLKLEKLKELEEKVSKQFGIESEDKAISKPQQKSLTSEDVVETKPDVQKEPELAEPFTDTSIKNRLTTGIDSLKKAGTDLAGNVKKFLDENIMLNDKEIAALRERGLITRAEWESFKALPSNVLRAVRNELDRVPLTRDARIRNFARAYGIKESEVDGFMRNIKPPTSSEAGKDVRGGVQSLSKNLKLPNLDAAGKRKAIKAFVDTNLTVENLKSLARGPISGVKRMVTGLGRLPKSSLDAIKLLMTDVHQRAIEPAIKKMVAADAKTYKEKPGNSDVQPRGLLIDWVTNNKKKLTVMDMLGGQDTLVKAAVDNFGVTRVEAQKELMPVLNPGLDKTFKNIARAKELTITPEQLTPEQNNAAQALISRIERLPNKAQSPELRALQKDLTNLPREQREALAVVLFEKYSSAADRQAITSRLINPAAHDMPGLENLPKQVEESPERITLRNQRLSTKPIDAPKGYEYYEKKPGEWALRPISEKITPQATSPQEKGELLGATLKANKRIVGELFGIDGEMERVAQKENGGALGTFLRQIGKDAASKGPQPLLDPQQKEVLERGLEVMVGTQLMRDVERTPTTEQKNLNPLTMAKQWVDKKDNSLALQGALRLFGGVKNEDAQTVISNSLAKIFQLEKSEADDLVKAVTQKN